MTLVALIKYKAKRENETSQQQTADTREAHRNLCFYTTSSSIPADCAAVSRYKVLNSKIMYFGFGVLFDNGTLFRLQPPRNTNGVVRHFLA